MNGQSLKSFLAKGLAAQQAADRAVCDAAAIKKTDDVEWLRSVVSNAEQPVQARLAAGRRLRELAKRTKR